MLVRKVMKNVPLIEEFASLVHISKQGFDYFFLFSMSAHSRLRELLKWVKGQ